MDGKPEAERTGREQIKSRGDTLDFATGFLDFARKDSKVILSEFQFGGLPAVALAKEGDSSMLFV